MGAECGALRQTSGGVLAARHLLSSKAELTVETLKRSSPLEVAPPRFSDNNRRTRGRTGTRRGEETSQKTIKQQPLRFHTTFIIHHISEDVQLCLPTDRRAEGLLAAAAARPERRNNNAQQENTERER